MDTDSLSFRFEEHFSSFESSSFLNVDDDSLSMEETFGASSVGNGWDWEVERELNGDIALIPMSSEIGMHYSSDSPPNRGDFQNIMSELHIDVPDIVALATDMPLSADDENETYNGGITSNSLPALDMPISPSSFDLLEFASEEDTKPIIKTNRPSGKKIDMNAQCYIVDKKELVIPKIEQTDSSDDETDFITPKSEQIDIVDEEIPDIFLKTEPVEHQPDENLPDIDKDNNDSENDFIDVDTISEQGTPILQAGDLNSLLEQFEATETFQCIEPPAPQLSADTQLFESQPPPPPITIVEPVVPANDPAAVHVNIKNNTETTGDDDPDKNKQILDALPQELIMRIKASSKRRVIPVIDPMPNKRRGAKKAQVEVQCIQQIAQEKEEKVVNSEAVQLDHDYCSQPTPYPKHPKKDSGFESAEEDEQRNILRNQPTVKGANGKLMVSLLKINTIRSNAVVDADSNKKKRKLNLEEYKKRREGFLKSGDNSRSNSPATSGGSSPVAAVEDENTRLLKHQQKLMQMAAEVLKTPPRSARKPSVAPTDVSTPAVSPLAQNFPAPPPPRTPPDGMEVKVTVNMGTNTDVTCHDAIVAWKQLNVPVRELEEIKPILQNASAKISNNSLITSVIENIRHKKTRQTTTAVVQNKVNGESNEHGENKVYLYRPKSSRAAATNSVEVQTTESYIRRKRKRNSSSSSSIDQPRSYKRRSGSNDSRYSYSSQSSSTYASSSGSRSRSPSPQRIYNKKRTIETEYLRDVEERRSPSPQRMYNRRTKTRSIDAEYARAVEERRIVFVGGLNLCTTKDDLQRRFKQFGTITEVTTHLRDNGRDKFGFVTYLHKKDAYNAVEHGNDDPTQPRYDISFGGRRIFCGTGYSDLDNVQDDMNHALPQIDDSFDSLLREAQAKLRKRKSCA